MPHICFKYKSLVLLLYVVFTCLLTAQKKIINSGWQYSSDKTTWETVNIPHTWNATDAFDDEPGYRRGFGYYQKSLFIASESQDQIHYLKFNGVNQSAVLYVNGKEVGTHHGGYTAFNFDITAYLNYDAYNRIEVTVDNSHNEDIPPLDADFTFYGGIYRDVEFISLPKQHISLQDFASDGFYINYNEISEESASISVSVLMDNFHSKTSKSHLKLRLRDAEGNLVFEEHQGVSLSKNSTETKVIHFPKLKNPKLWSPDQPYLYRLDITLEDQKGLELDSKSSRIGLRWASVDPKKGFFLNGKSLKLIGVNRHQDYEGFGNAVPVALQEKDLHLINAMGANVLRFAHYPQDRALYKLCDELGILVWSEIPVVNKVTNSKAFFEVALNMQKAHIKQYYNFSSVVMLGYMNEIFLRLAFEKQASEAEKIERKQYTYELAKQLEALTRAEAPNHITVMALHYNELYNETKIADLSMLVGWNLYFGWYHDTIADLGPFLDDQHQRFPQRSIMISEYGPGADVRISASEPLRYDYSQDYQLLLHSGYVKQVKERDFVAGMTAWNFADFGSEFRGETIPHVNQKGIVQYNREPKEVYYWYQSILTESPKVHIVQYQKDVTLVQTDVHELTLFSNENKGEVFLNDQFVDTVTFSDGIAKVVLPFASGENRVRVKTANTQDKATFQVRRLQNLKTEQPDVLGINLGTHINFKDKVSGISYLHDRPYSKGLYGYVDSSGKCEKKLISNNIKNSNLEAVYQSVLMDCNTYRVDLAEGYYKVTLYLVEPHLKSDAELVYNLNHGNKTAKDKQGQRIYNLSLNEQTLVKAWNMAALFPDKYGLTLSAEIRIVEDEGLTIHLDPIKNKTVLSGLLIEKLD